MIMKRDRHFLFPKKNLLICDNYRRELGKRFWKNNLYHINI